MNGLFGFVSLIAIDTFPFVLGLSVVGIFVVTGNAIRQATFWTMAALGVAGAAFISSSPQPDRSPQPSRPRVPANSSSVPTLPTLSKARHNDSDTNSDQEVSVAVVR